MATSEPDRPVVFCSHSSKDNPVVARFAGRLRADGIDAWLDVWEMSAGDNLVTKINEGLARSTAGLIFFSEHTGGSMWVNAEVSTLIYRAVQGLRVIPVILDDQAIVPPLLEPYIRQPIEDYEAIRDALLGRRGRPPLGPLPQRSWAELVIRLTPAGDQVWVQSWLGGAALADEVVRRPALLHRGSEVGVRSEEGLAELGRAMGRLLFPSESGARVQRALTERQPGDRLDVVFEATAAELLGLPVEATRLPVSGSPLLIEFDGVTVVRRPAHLPNRLTPAVPGPLKILVAIAAPDEGKTASSASYGPTAERTRTAAERRRPGRAARRSSCRDACLAGHRTGPPRRRAGARGRWGRQEQHRRPRDAPGPGPRLGSRRRTAGHLAPDHGGPARARRAQRPRRRDPDRPACPTSR